MENILHHHGGELTEVVANYEWRAVDSDGKSYGQIVKIKVLKGANGRFVAHPNHSVRSTGQATPYLSLEEKPSIKAALEDCFLSFGLFKHSVDESEWIKNPYF